MKSGRPGDVRHPWEGGRTNVLLTFPVMVTRRALPYPCNSQRARRSLRTA
jgi:hypothetical protein